VPKNKIDAILDGHEQGKSFAAEEIILDADECRNWVRFKVEPSRFLPKIFDGEWANINQHPEPGKIRLLRVITGNDGISRIIARQGNKLFANPWFK
jgi:hypothetical protein